MKGMSVLSVTRCTPSRHTWDAWVYEYGHDGHTTTAMRDMKTLPAAAGVGW